MYQCLGHVDCRRYCIVHYEPALSLRLTEKEYGAEVNDVVDEEQQVYNA